jgi:phosphoglycolate phosphatase
MSAHKKFIAWDWNGTLLDDTDAVLDCVNIVLNKMGKAPIGMDLFRATQVRPLKNFYMAIGLSEEETPHALDHERSTFHDHYESMSHELPLRDGANALLNHLRRNDVSNVIVSNHITDEIIKLLKVHDIHHHFDEVLAYPSRTVQFREPKGEKLRHYITLNDLTASNAVIVGDTLEEIEIARDMGLMSVAITGGLHSESRLRALNPNYVVHSMHELKSILHEKGFLS